MFSSKKALNSCPFMQNFELSPTKILDFTEVEIWHNLFFNDYYFDIKNEIKWSFAIIFL